MSLTPTDSTSSPFYNWSLDELNNENTIVPWEEVFKARLANPNELERYGLLDNPDEDIIAIYYSSPKDSWKNLAGMAGYLLISKKEKKQLEFITLIIS